MSPPRQVVVVLDVRGTLPDELIVPLLPPDRLSLEFVRLPEAVLNDVRAGSLSLQGLSHAVRDLVEETRRRAGSGVVEWYVCGLAPLPLFAQLGFELSAWAGLVVVLNRRKEGEWDAIPVNGGGAADSKFFARTAGMDACSYASGRLAVVVSVTGDEPNREAIRLFLEEHGETLAGIVELRSEGPKILDASNAGDAARELTDTFARLPSLYPNACNHGLAVFVAGPAPLAVLAGRAVNPNVIKGCWFPEHRAGTYVDLVSIPVRGRPSRTLDMSESSVTDRQRVKGLIQRALSVLQEKVTAEIVPGTGGVSANEFIATLRDLQVVEGPENGSFRLSILERSMSVGDGLLEALRQIPETEAILIGRQLIIHELFHVWQGLSFGNYREIGRAGVVLEEIDYWADVFSIQVLARLGGEANADGGQDEVAGVQRELRSVLQGIEIFDRSEQGARLENLYERRLRRYLIWALQIARARTLRTGRDVEAMFSERLTAELAPLASHLDERYDKIVSKGLTHTELFVSTGRSVCRFSASPNLVPADLVGLVREFRIDEVVTLFQRVVDQEGSTLASWVP